MDYQEFLVWLETERKMSKRAAKDVVSRLKRVIGLMSCDALDSSSISKLNAIAEFDACSMFIKSQLRRSVALYLEFSSK